MYSSLFSPEAKKIFSDAEKQAGTAGGPFNSPAEWRDLIIYFIMVDRFNNPVASPVYKPYDDKNFGLYQGGKFEGIKQKLSYIKGLGAGAIWLSPVLKNLPWDQGSYHGYGIHDFIRAEPKFAIVQENADDELRSLVDAAHESGLYVIFDIVLNHTGDVFAYNGQSATTFSASVLPVQWRDVNGQAVPDNPDVAAINNPSVDSVVWPVEFQNNSFFRRQGSSPDLTGDDTVGDFQSLKQIMTGDPNVLKFLIKAYQYVMARYDVDGFRIDTLRFLKNNSAQIFGNAIREYALLLNKKNFFTFGEVLGGDEETEIAAFIGRNTQTGDDLNSLVGVDSALDYPLFTSLVSVLKGFTAPSVLVDLYNNRKKKEQFILSTHGDASRYFVTFLDNHDMKRRFRYQLPGNENFFDDQVTMGIACLFCLPGIPAIYYGTEQGLHGFDDRDKPQDFAVREALWGLYPDWPDTGLFYSEIQKMSLIRSSEPALRYGRFYFRQISGDHFHFDISSYQNGIIAWSRILNDEEVIIIANTNSIQTQSVDIILEMTLSTPEQNMSVLYSNKKQFTVPTPVKSISSVQVTELDGSIGQGPVNTTNVTLLPMEVQILRGQHS